MARVRCNWAMCCSPEPIAKLMRVFPKLALLFLVIHVTVMIYSVMKPYPPGVKSGASDAPPGVVDPKMRIPGLTDVAYNIRDNMNNLTASVNGTRSKKTAQGLDNQEKAQNRTRESLLDRLHGIKSHRNSPDEGRQLR